MIKSISATNHPLKERTAIWLLCLLAGVHVLIFSAAFPFFNVMDEQVHFDLVMRYAQNDVPRTISPLCDEALTCIATYGTAEYFWPPESQPNGRYEPPPWKQPVKISGPRIAETKADWKKGVVNYESSQPPSYYILAGGWWHLGRLLGLHGGHLLYWLRFLNVLFVAAFLWICWRATQILFPDKRFMRITVATVIALWPQTTFYSIQNDVLLPLGFGVVFLLMIRWWQKGVPSIQLSATVGVLLAFTYLIKLSSMPLLAIVAATLLLCSFLDRPKTTKWFSLLPSLVIFCSCMALPIIAWMSWCKYHYGDFTGSAAKVQFLGWTEKPTSLWLSHPLFTAHGIWTFCLGILTTFWQGEMSWHRNPINLKSINLFYTLLSLSLLAIALVSFGFRPKSVTPLQRRFLWFGLLSIGLSVAFWGYLSIIFDFHDCFYPSRIYPYFASGRLILGVAMPFMILFAYGLDRLLTWLKFEEPTKYLVLAVLGTFMLVSEITTDLRIFSSAYNWFHL